MTDDRRETDIAIAELVVKVGALQEGHEKVWNKLGEMHILLHDQCNDCPPSVVSADHEIRLRAEEKKSNILDGKINGLKAVSAVISSIVGLLVTGVGFFFGLHK